MSTPPLNRPLCCLMFPGCICKPKANKPVHFLSLKIYRTPKQHTTTSEINPLVIKSKCRKMKVMVTPERLPVWELAMSTTQDSPGSKRSRGTTLSASQGKTTSSTVPSTCASGSWTESQPSGERTEGQGRWLSTQNPSQLNDPRFPLAHSLMTETSAASTSTSCSLEGSFEPSKSWAISASSPTYTDSNAVQSKSDSWRSTKGYWTDNARPSIESMPSTSLNAIPTPRRPNKLGDALQRQRCALGPPPSSTKVSTWARDRTGSK